MIKWGRFSNHILVLILLILNVGCVQDVDFDQARDITLNADVDLDLIYFRLDESNYFNENSEGSFPTYLKQESLFDFFSDDFFQENLTSISFLFQAESTFSQKFITRIRFLNPDDEVQYELDFEIKPSEDSSLTFTEKESLMTTEDIQLFKSGPITKIEISIQIIENGLPIRGSLYFKSKAIYSLGNS